jgi:hypothetical protein
MIWLLLLGFIFVILLDAYSDGDLDNIIKKVRSWLKKPLLDRSKKQDK